LGRQTLVEGVIILDCITIAPGLGSSRRSGENGKSGAKGQRK